ncbi:MAG: hypothetical protein ACLGIO_06880, partial [Acidimicrobiia bacterium]
MTLPEDAGAPPRDGDPAPRAAEAAAGPAAGAEPAATLPDKPILEWTEEDWATWIARPPALPGDDRPAAGEAPTTAADAPAGGRAGGGGDDGPGPAGEAGAAGEAPGGEAGAAGGHPDAAVATAVDGEARGGDTAGPGQAAGGTTETVEQAGPAPGAPDGRPAVEPVADRDDGTGVPEPDRRPAGAWGGDQQGDAADEGSTQPPEEQALERERPPQPDAGGGRPGAGGPAGVAAGAGAAAEPTGPGAGTEARPWWEASPPPLSPPSPPPGADG